MTDYHAESAPAGSGGGGTSAAWTGPTPLDRFLTAITGERDLEAGQ